MCFLQDNRKWSVNVASRALPMVAASLKLMLAWLADVGYCGGSNKNKLRVRKAEDILIG